MPIPVTNPALRDEATTEKMNAHPRRTKIIATLGPATESPEMIRRLIETGVNIFRFNMSHAAGDWIRKVAREVRIQSSALEVHVALMLDTQGPAIRTGDVVKPIPLKPGDTFIFTTRGVKLAEEYSVSVNYDGLVDDVAVGDLLLVDNGLLHMRAIDKKNGNQLQCEVLTSGILGSRRHINLPGVHVKLPAITEKDFADIEAGLDCGVDYIALSFVRQAEDVQQLRALLEEKGARHVRIVAKIEDQLAVKNFESIREAADAIMVARGDLGIEVPYEELPIIQRRIVKTCVAQSRPVIVATHLLESMINSPMPTRAEITDVANAVYEQADAIMLSAETTVGHYPVECIQVLDRIAVRTERSGNAGYANHVFLSSDRQKIVAAAVHLANQTRAVGLCVFTRHGYLAGIAAALRPTSTRIFAFAPNEQLCRRLSFLYGVTSIYSTFSYTPDENVIKAEAKLVNRRYAKKGDKLVIISDLIASDHIVDSIQLHTIS